MQFGENVTVETLIQPIFMAKFNTWVTLVTQRNRCHGVTNPSPVDHNPNHFSNSDGDRCNFWCHLGCEVTPLSLKRGGVTVTHATRGGF